jgi:hypothetical protein
MLFNKIILKLLLKNLLFRINKEILFKYKLVNKQFFQIKKEYKKDVIYKLILLNKIKLVYNL